MNSNQETSEMPKECKTLYQMKLDIVSLFNELIKSTFPERHQELVIRDNEKRPIFELLKFKLRTLELTANGTTDSSEDIFAINVFKALFIGENDFNMDDLDEKEAYFILVLKRLKEEGMDASDATKIIEIKKEAENSAISKLLSLFGGFTFENKGYFYFCFSLIFKYMKFNSILIDSFVIFMKNKIFYYEQDLVLRKEYKDEEISKISKEALIDDLIKIYEKFGKKSSSLYYDNNHLSIKIIHDEENNSPIKKEGIKERTKRKRII